MRTRIVHDQPFGRGGGIEVSIGRDQCHRTEPGLLALLADFEGDRQLYGIILPRQQRRSHSNPKRERGSDEIK